MSQSISPPQPADAGLDTEFQRGLGLFDATMVVVGSPAWLLVAWLLTGASIIRAALSYGELAAMMPRGRTVSLFVRGLLAV